MGGVPSPPGAGTVPDSQAPMLPSGWIRPCSEEAARGPPQHGPRHLPDRSGWFRGAGHPPCRTEDHQTGTADSDRLRRTPGADSHSVSPEEWQPGPPRCWAHWARTMLSAHRPLLEKVPDVETQGDLEELVPLQDACVPCPRDAARCPETHAGLSCPWAFFPWHFAATTQRGQGR